LGHSFQGIIAVVDEGGSQQQVFGRITAQREFGCQQQSRAASVSIMSRIDYFSGIARHIAHYKIELGNADRDGHGA
jgi:hypothetical protein